MKLCFLAAIATFAFKTGAEGDAREAQTSTTTSLTLQIKDPNVDCQSALVSVQKRPDVVLGISLLNSDGKLNLEAILLQSQVSEGATESLAAELNSLIYDSLLFRSRLISHLLYQVLVKRNIHQFKQAENYITRFYLLSEKEKREITEEVLFKLMCVLEHFDSTRGTYNPINIAAEFGIDHESFLSLLKYWHTYASSDPGLYRLQLAMLFVLQYSPQLVLKDLKSFNSFFTKYQKTQFSFYGDTASQKAPRLTFEQRAFSTSLDLLSNEYFRKPNIYSSSPYDDSYNRHHQADNILNHPNLYFLEFYLHRNLEFFNLKSLLHIKEKFFSSMKPETQFLLLKTIEALEAIQKPVAAAFARVKEHSENVALHKANIDRFEDRKNDLLKNKVVLQNEIEVFKVQGQNPLLRAISQNVRAKGAKFYVTVSESLKDIKPIFHEYISRTTSQDFVRSIEYLFPYIAYSKEIDSRSWAASWILWIRGLARYYTLTRTDRLYLFDNIQSKFLLDPHVKSEDLSYLKALLDEENWGNEEVKSKRKSKSKSKGKATISKDAPKKQITSEKTRPNNTPNKGLEKDSPELANLNAELTKIETELKELEEKLLESRKFLSESSNKEAELSNEAEALKAQLLKEITQ